MRLDPGARLGPYQIVASLGAGGMGEVYKARDTRLERNVAIKVLPAADAADARRRQRLEREAKAISALNHPNICALYDIGHHNGTDYLVMELLEGETLSDRLSRGRMRAEEVFRYGIEIAEALDKAHRQGIIHRDLKPGNIMLTRSGAKLLDFGLAKSFLTSRSDGSATEARPLTSEHAVVGTFAYMAPEQREGLDADSRSDIYALGAVLYEMATGKRASDERKPETLTPPAFEHVVAKCLEADRDARWQSAHDVAEELRWIGAASPPAPKSNTREWVAWSVVAIVAVAAIVVAVRFTRSGRTDARALESSILAPEGVTFNFALHNSGSLSISPDGRYVTFSARQGNGPLMIWLRALDTSTARPLPGTDDGHYPFWSPDSSNIGFFAGGKLKRIDLKGAAPVVVCDAAEGRGGAWSQDGTIVFAPNIRTSLLAVSAGGGETRPVTDIDAEQMETTHRWPAFLPDGKHFLFMAGSHVSPSGSRNVLFVAELGSKLRKPLLSTRSNAAYSSGHLLYLRQGTLMAQRFDPDKLELRGEPWAVVDGLQYYSVGFHAAFAASSDGTLVYHRGDSEISRLLVLYDRTGKEIQTLGNPGIYRDVHFSPDQTRLAFSLEDSVSGTFDIWIHDLARNARTRLTFGAKNETWPTWSPDGTRIAFVDDRRGGFDDIYVKDADGRNPEQLLMRENARHNLYAWSGDGRYLAYTRVDARGKGDIWVLPLFGDRKPFPFLSTPQFEETGAQFSADGRWMAYVSDESGVLEIYIVSFPDRKGKWQISNRAINVPLWRGNRITYNGPNSEYLAVSVEERSGRIEWSPPAEEPWLTSLNPRSFGGDRSGELVVRVLRPEAGPPAPIGLIANWNALKRPDSN